ncbi:MAG TPA: substrate-binding domain-containing protein [Rhodocyclaceae bacterium]|nr:helix-turn-helix transcriptional regulator [Rhodocyclaceae bacterium]HMV54705.1 substrate-binding domain-containing protein [Rhodocyclaceae bacterium]HNA04917.1 substrate-binding domain-containing protein [Rhodocyclaceae bacterium]HNB80085.1 substrate-binding domain-containing protein [Rhodocyclaceae bacterium]HNC62604.1 substrate-binding domain-containing protein [Rhodocyclaceae bacterium]
MSDLTLPAGTRGRKARTMKPGPLPFSLRVSFSLSPDDGQRGVTPDDTLFLLLEGVRTSGSLSQAARALGMSYRHAWGMMREKEQQLGTELIVKQRGRGATLTAFGARLVWAQQRIMSRFVPVAASLEAEFLSELQEDLFAEKETLRLRASHDLALPILREEIEHRSSDVFVDLRFSGSEENLKALAQGACDIAGFHCARNQRKGSVQHIGYRRWLKPKEHRLIRFATRVQGLMMRPSLDGQINSFSDIARAGLRFINRQKGSGTRLVTDQFLTDERVQPRQILGYDLEEYTHLGVATRIAAGAADVGVGIEAAAQQMGLAFVPLVPEDYFLLVNEAGLEHGTITTLIEVLHDARFRRRVANLAGYDTSDAGEVVRLTAALPWYIAGSTRSP